MGLSLRDLQEALYFLVGHVRSRNAVNQVTLQVQKQLEDRRLARQDAENRCCGWGVGEDSGHWRRFQIRSCGSLAANSSSRRTGDFSRLSGLGGWVLCNTAL